MCWEGAVSTYKRVNNVSNVSAPLSIFWEHVPTHLRRKLQSRGPRTQSWAMPTCKRGKHRQQKQRMVWEFRGKPEDNSIKEAKRGKSVNGSSGTQCLSGSEEKKNQGKPLILVMKWSKVVLCGDSITKLHVLLCLCLVPSGVGYVVFRRAWPFQATVKTLLQPSEWGEHSGIRKVVIWWGHWKSEGNQERELLDLPGSGIQKECEEGLKKLSHKGKPLSATANQQGGICKLKVCEKALLCCADNLASGYFVVCLPQIIIYLV